MGARRADLTAQATSERKSKVPARTSKRRPQEATLAALASKSIFRFAQGLITTARLNVSTRPCSGMLARIAAGLLSAASCCLVWGLAGRVYPAFSYVGVSSVGFFCVRFAVV